MNLTFDTPEWDSDELVVEEIDQSTGRYECVHRFGTSAADLPESIRGINKVARYVDVSIAQWASGVRDQLVVDVNGAVKLQLAVELACNPVARAKGYEDRNIFGRRSERLHGVVPLP